MTVDGIEWRFLNDLFGQFEILCVCVMNVVREWVDGYKLVEFSISFVGKRYKS